MKIEISRSRLYNRRIVYVTYLNFFNFELYGSETYKFGIKLNVILPKFIMKDDFIIFSIDNDGYCDLMDLKSNKIRSDIKIDKITEYERVLASNIERALQESRSIGVTVLSYKDIHKIVEMKTITNVNELW